MNFTHFLAIGSVVLLTWACGSKDDNKASTDSSFDAGTFPSALLQEFSAWTPTLEGDQTFNSPGHGGITVRSYLNEVAKNHVAAVSDPYPMAVGSTLAKAVVSSSEAAVGAASTVYFMKKEATGFDTENGDWSYAVARRANGVLEYDASVGPKQQLCVSCHAKFSEYDYVQTIEFYKRQSTSL